MNSQELGNELMLTARLPKPHLMGEIVWELVRHYRKQHAKAENDGQEIHDAILCADPKGLPFSGPARKNWEVVEAMKLFLATTDGQCCLTLLGMWAEHGFQTVAMPATYAAALLATAVHPDVVPFVEVPFPAFVIDVPSGLLPVSSETKENDCIRRIAVCTYDHHRLGRAWAYFSWSDGHVSLWRFGTLSSILQAEFESELGTELQSFPLEYTDVDQRTQALIGRLIVNCCLAMRDPDNLRTRRNQHSVGKRLDLDLTGQVQQYAKGGGSPLTFGHWVSPHWKQQRFGPALVYTKLIFVEPYWRGPVLGESTGEK